jgi:hypothetical protein
VYTYAMSRRTQITFSDDQHDFLLEESERTGLSAAELVRRAVELAYRPEQRPTIGGYEFTFGVWKRPDAAIVGRRPPRRRRALDR